MEEAAELTGLRERERTFYDRLRHAPWGGSRFIFIYRDTGGIRGFWVHAVGRFFGGSVWRSRNFTGFCADLLMRRVWSVTGWPEMLIKSFIELYGWTGAVAVTWVANQFGN